MKKRIQLFLLLFLFTVFTFRMYAQNNNISTVTTSLPATNGYYQTINLDAETPCSCSDKTQRTYDLAKGLRPNDVKNYELHAYQFKFGPSTIPVSKLFKAFENDATVYKVSMKEWDSFMLLTTKDFNVSSFETAAMKIFDSFSLMLPEDFLKTKNIDSYNEYIQELGRNKK